MSSFDDKSSEFEADPDRERVELARPERSVRVIIAFVVGAVVILGVMALIASQVL